MRILSFKTVYTLGNDTFLYHTLDSSLVEKRARFDARQQWFGV